MASSGTIREVGGGGAQRIAVEDLASHLATLEAELSGGRAIELVRGGVVVAEVRGVKPIEDERPMPDFKARLRDIWGTRPVDVDMTAVVRSDRDEEVELVRKPFRERMPDYRAQMREVFGDEVLDVDTAEWVAEGRDRDLLL